MHRESYRSHLESLGARWAVDGEERWVESFGDVADEYGAVAESGLGLIDRSERETLVITGDDAIPWLQGLVTSDLFELAEEGSGQIGCAVNQNGRLIADVRFLHVPELLLIDLERGRREALLSHLRRHIIMEKVKVTDRTEQTGRIGVYGARAASLLEGVADLAHPLSERGDYQGSWGSVGEEDVIVQRLPWLGYEGFEIYCGADGALNVWRALEEADPEARPLGNEAFEMLRIEAGMPRFGVELGEKVIPLEANLNEAISFEKGCYLGQEIIARLDTLGTPARLLRRLLIEADEVPAPGTKLLAEGKSVGEIIRAIRSPKYGQPMALGYVKRKHNDVGTVLDLEGGGSVSLESLS
ncbi:MAG: YgfZ/GcvT domain-containing protein [Bradymonadaceae bacterium]